VSTYEQHLALSAERELARIEAQQNQDVADLVDDLWDAKPYDPNDPDDVPDYGWEDAA
jgi:hypothetical protein